MISKNTFTLRINGQKREVEIPNSLKKDNPIKLDKRAKILSSILLIILVVFLVYINLDDSDKPSSVKKTTRAMKHKKRKKTVDRKRAKEKTNIEKYNDNLDNEDYNNRDSEKDNEILKDYDKMLKY